MDLHIESIEGGTYLATIVEEDGTRLIKSNGNEPLVFHCITEIRSHLSNLTFDQVWLKQTTPYDEMCGLEKSDEKLELLIDWQQ